MIRLRARYNELARALVTRIHIDSCIGHSLRIHKGNELEQQVRLRLEKVGSLALDGGFKLLSVGPRDSVPRLSFTPVHLRKLSISVKER
jgi:hypothetical protein